MNFKLEKLLPLIIFGSVCFFSSVPVHSEGTEAPLSPIPAKIYEVSPVTQNVSWVTENSKRNITLIHFENRPYISITDLARLSEAQLGWQAPSQQACLSKIRSLLCFSWKDSVVFFDGKKTKPSYNVRFVDNQLFVAFDFVTSKYFEKFTRTELAFNSEKKELTQKIPVTLEIPPVENRGEYYSLSLPMASEDSYEVLKKAPNQLWLRMKGGRTAGSSILEGDDVIQEIKIIQKRHSADMMVKLGGGSSSYDLNFDPASKKLNLLVRLRNPVETPETSKEEKSSFSQTEVPFVEPPLVSEPKVNAGPVAAIPAPPATEIPKAVPLAIPTGKKVAIPSKSKDKNIRTVVIDAGHGGFDSGAMGVRGTLEKTINLRVAAAVADRLRKEKRLRVIMTRENDLFLPLDERTRMANEAGADLFVSVHCNSSVSAKHTGFEVYLLSGEASDEAAASVARFENSVVALESKKGDGSEKLTELLASMAVNNYMNDSSELAAVICRGVRKTSAVKQTFVKEANFFVLRGAQMPSVLLELDYLSNPISELKLRSSRFASIVAKGIAQGVLEFADRQRKKEEVISARSSQQSSGLPQ